MSGGAAEAGVRATGAGHAELAEVWPRDGHIRLLGQVHRPEAEGRATAGARPGADGAWRLRLVLREGESAPRAAAGELEYDLTRLAPDGHFEASFPVADLVPDGLPLPATWDVYLHPPASGEPGAAPLRVGRRLDDIRDKKRIMLFPAQPVSGAAGSALVRPYYTVKENLSVRCRPAEDGPRRDAGRGARGRTAPRKRWGRGGWRAWRAWGSRNRRARKGGRHG